MIAKRSFKELFERASWEGLRSIVYSKQTRDVERAVAHAGRGSFDDFLALLSPAAEPCLDDLLELSSTKTRQRFGNTIQLYAPLYLSNECQNICTYCGFSFDNRIERLTLDEAQIKRESRHLKELGFEHVLVVTGEAPKIVGMDYFGRALIQLNRDFAQVSFEVQPLEQEDYALLGSQGVYAVLVYQETYNVERYREYHPRGKKSNFAYRLETPERAGRAGMHKIGLGALLGLEDWRVEAAFVGLHLDFLERQFWRSRFSISFPRLRPAQGAIRPKVIVEDRHLLQLICAYRLFNENVELTLSTRERPAFREQLARCGITSMSAGSKTEPGGYAVKSQALKQFEICDERSPGEVAQALRGLGLEPVWKDWEASWCINQAQVS